MWIGKRAALAGLLGAALLGGSAGPLRAQGVTTGAIAGTVTDEQGQPVVNAQVTVVNRATGYSTSALTRNNGFYLVQGLEVGGPYTVTITSIGYQEYRRDEIYVRLSATTRVDARLSVSAVELEALAISVARTGDFSPTRQGVSSVVSDTLLRRMPTLSRDFVDLVKLTPQVVFPASGAASAGGAYNRYNTFTIDGANQSERFNLGSTGGIPGGGSGGKIISTEAVKEFRVMMTPTDVRQGNFAGMLVNAVTKSGTNEFHGGAIFSYRNEAMAAEPLREPEYNVAQYGFHVGGPIMRDRLHFFIASEWQQRSTPAGGPYYTASGAPSPAPNTPAVPLDSLQAIADIMRDQYGFDVGGVGPVDLETPLTNLFGRIDFAISPNHRLVLRQLINRAEDGSFFRNSNTLTPTANAQNSGFRFGSNMYSRVNRNNSTVLQLYSNFPSGISNELIVGYNTIEDVRDVPVAAPEISVGVGDPARAVTFGTEQFSPGNLLEQDIFEIVNNVTIPFGDHTITVGGRLDHTHIFNNFAQRSYGVYVFPTIEALRNGEPSSYSIGYDNSGTGRGIPADFRVQMYSLYAQDQWTVNDRLTLTYGLRADIPRFLDRPLLNQRLLDSLAFNEHEPIRTDAVPKTQVLWSPRFGFNYDPTGDQQNQVRGNIGIFTGPPPYILLGNAFANTGLGLVTLNCNGPATPEFTLDVSQLPRACAGQSPPAPGQAWTAGVNVTDPNFKYPQYLGMSLGFDRQLPYNTVLTVEGMYRKAINGVLVRDRNLKGPRMVGGQPYRDRDGRVLYADTIDAGGNVDNEGQRVLGSITEGIIEVTNQSEDYNYSISAQLSRRFSESFEAAVGYTYLQSKDVQSLTSDRAISNWRNGRQLSTSHDDLTPTTSYFERPHRIIAYGTYTLPWKLTDISLYYEGISGTPITYVTNRDLNGDGWTNDPIYVPRDATDPNEIRIGTGIGAAFVQDMAAAQAFEEFIEKQPCLDKQRGKIMERNSCRSPFQHRLDLSIRQSIPQIRGNQLTVQLDIFNFLNFVNKDWGLVKLPTLGPTFPDQRALIHQGRNPGPLNQSIPTYQFDNRLWQNGAGPFDAVAVSSNYQMQLTVRYAF
jgi:hypothetical protein